MKRTVLLRPDHEPASGDIAHWVTSEQACVRLGIGRNSLAEWRCDRRVNQPPYAKFGKAVRYRVSDVDAWAADQIVRDSR